MTTVKGFLWRGAAHRETREDPPPRITVDDETYVQWDGMEVRHNNEDELLYVLECGSNIESESIHVFDEQPPT